MAAITKDPARRMWMGIVAEIDVVAVRMMYVEVHTRGLALLPTLYENDPGMLAVFAETPEVHEMPAWALKVKDAQARFWARKAAEQRAKGI